MYYKYKITEVLIKHFLLKQSILSLHLSNHELRAVQLMGKHSTKNIISLKDGIY